MIRIIRNESQLKGFIDLLKNRSEGVSEETSRTVSDILFDVKERGDRAVLDYTGRFDGISVRSLKISGQEIEEASRHAGNEVIKALKTAAERIRRFHLRQLERSWRYREGGATLGQLIRPLRRVGAYVPGGKASYPSTVLMNVIPAQVAGVKEIAVCVPTPAGEVNPYVMASLKLLGITEVYRIGGAQAIGALAYGTETVRQVDKIVGPGNIYVALAKRMVFGTVDIDMIAGPSEVLIIADRTASAGFVASDLLSQAEHDELASSVLITTSGALARRVKEELKRQLRLLRRKRIAGSSIRNYGAIIITKTLKDAARISNLIAPEHLEVMTDDPEGLLPEIENAGAVFLGRWTPEPLGDYVAGPNHTLPTGGTARFFSPLGVYDFLKRSSLLRFERDAFLKLSQTVETISEIEGLEAHANTIRVRRGRSRKSP